MSKPRLLDLFCGPGGAAMGYHRAGFEVVGIDIAPQPSYPFEFFQGDALDWLRQSHTTFEQFDAIHASPPCQAFSSLRRATKADNPDLLTPTRELLRRLGLPYVIENVEGAPLVNPWRLCGTMFDLPIRRHRLFEFSFSVSALLPPCACRGRVASGELIGHRLSGKVAPGRRQPPSRPESARLAALDVPWMRGREARQAIPPAYTEWAGRQLLEVL